MKFRPKHNIVATTFVPANTTGTQIVSVPQSNMKQYYDPFFVSANIALNRKDKETKHYLVAWNLGNFFGSTSHEQVGDSAVFPKFPR